MDFAELAVKATVLLTSGPMNVKELGEKLGLKPKQTADLVGRMAVDGFIKLTAELQ